MKTGDYQGAMQDFNQVLVIDPDSAKELAQFFKPDFAKSLKGDLKKLATETSPSKQSHSTGTKPEDEGLSNREIARLNNDAAKAIRQGHFENAITILEKLARDFPKYDFARNNLSIAYNNQGLKVARREPQKSISQFRAALFYSPAEAAARRNLNSILVEQGMDPANYATRLSLGDTVKAQGDYRGAFVEYSEALRLKNTPELRHRLASVCVKLDGAAKDDSETEAGEHSAKAAGSLKAAGLNLVRRHSSTLATNSPTPHATPSAMTHPAHKKVIGREDLEQECKHLIESGSKNFNDGNYVEAQLDFERSITVARQLGQDTRLMADSLEKLAGIHIVRNNSHAATKALTEALRINEKLLPADDPIIEKTREKLETLHHRAEE